MEEESDDEYDEELEMNLNSFRNEAAKNPPIIVAYDENDEEGYWNKKLNLIFK